MRSAVSISSIHEPVRGRIRSRRQKGAHAFLASLIRVGSVVATLIVSSPSWAQDLESLAEDAVTQLAASHSVQTRFALERPANDRFGRSLVARLRSAGYAVQDKQGGGSLALDYLVDQPTNDLYRVTVSVDGKVLTHLAKQRSTGTGEHPGGARRITAGAGTLGRAQAEETTRGHAFEVSPSDARLISVLVRWAQQAGLTPVLNGRRVTAETLAHESYTDLPLTREARASAGSSVDQATSSILRTYATYRTGIEVSAVRRAPHFLAITTKQRSPDAPVVMAAAAIPPTSLQPTAAPQIPSLQPATRKPEHTAAPRPAPATPSSQLPPANRFVAAAPPPQAGRAEQEARGPSVAVQPAWDTSARRAAGALEGVWTVGQSQSLRAVVESWASTAGFRVRWDSRHDYPVTDAVRAGVYPGTFKAALARLASAFGEFEVPLSMRFDNTNQGRPVLQVFDM
ncbi:TcpQ domain-containing protein [Variovorax sp. J22P168]|uniref:TcpQ domain-containing protein n=1 Tax=Variovorax jilinensis TaxID=3053513 RepID=UPI00257541EC|nr:TcpQ domain-containing protein [Variovorax sp. J22P168]MDM0015056.1 TcpQ domain-containing protein [Variovorax sp. J22P168]